MLRTARRSLDPSCHGASLPGPGSFVFAVAQHGSQLPCFLIRRASMPNITLACWGQRHLPRHLVCYGLSCAISKLRVLKLQTGPQTFLLGPLPIFISVYPLFVSITNYTTYIISPRLLPICHPDIRCAFWICSFSSLLRLFLLLNQNSRHASLTALGQIK